MKFNITKNLISIPPYISTSWDNVSSLSLQGELLHIQLKDGHIVDIPDLLPEQTEEIFALHASFLEAEEFDRETSSILEQAMGSSVNFTAFDEIGSVLQHNPEQADSPNLPTQILEKVTALSKVMSSDDIKAIPDAEPHCNCVHCQITRAILGMHTNDEEVLEEVIPEEELQFQQWEILPQENKMFTVVNRLDPQESYSVHLGEPVGCTCGKDGCDHIVAVLKTPLV